MRVLAWLIAVLMCVLGSEQAAASAGPAVAAADGVARWFDGAELQAETQDQRRALRTALADLLAQPTATLREARYPGLDGTPRARSLPQLLRQHLVPDPPRALDAEQLYAALGSPALRAAVQRRLDTVDAAIRASE